MKKIIAVPALFAFAFTALMTVVTPSFAQDSTAADRAGADAVADAEMAEGQPAEESLYPSRANERAEFVKDPVYAPISPDDDHPLTELFDLANDGDIRAQFILADLYSKGKGGVSKQPDAAKILFEHSAKLGAIESFIRLAAIAKKQDNLIEAYKWYELAVLRAPKGELRTWAEKARTDLQLKGKDLRAARKAAKEWDMMKLDPLVLNTPKKPFSKTAVKPKAAVESESDTKVETETKADVETATEAEPKQETTQNE